MKTETKDTITWYVLMTIITISTIAGVVCWCISRAWRFFFKEKTI